MADKEETQAVDSKPGHCETIQDDKMNFYNLWKVLAKRKMIIIAIFLISVLGSAIYCSTRPPTYRLETYAKLSMPKDIMTVKELPTAKDLALIIGNVDRGKRAIIFSKHKDEITEARIVEIKGSADKFKITIESRNLESLPSALQEFMEYVSNIREIKTNYQKIMSEIDAKIESVNEAARKNDIQIRELEKRLSNPKVVPAVFNPVEINNKMVDLKMEKYRLEQERQSYKPIQLLEEPFVSNDPIKPRTATVMALAGMVSLLFGVLLAFFAEYREHAKNR
jgi:hypothetical protein